MRELRSACFILSVVFFTSCSTSRTTVKTSPVSTPATKPSVILNDKTSGKTVSRKSIDVKGVSADSVVEFAKTLLGVKYKYGSAIKENGFDCSGFITYVFKHFNIAVPRSSVDFTNAGTPVSVYQSKPGDLILFTGTDTTGWVVGHMGMITKNDKGKITFIHSSSGKNIGVIISDMSNYYKTRFVKVIRLFM